MRNVRILAFHRVLPERRGTLSVRVADFERNLEHLLARGWSPLTLGELHDCYLSRGVAPERKTFVVTFDDGSRDNYVYAFPVLERLGIRATFFLVAGLVGTREPFPFDRDRRHLLEDIDFSMDASEVLEMAAVGMDFGSHTLSHPRLPEIPLAAARQEIRASRARLGELLGQDVISFCYPEGRFNRELVAEVEAAGYRVAVVTPRDAGVRESAFTLRRVGLYAHDGPASFRFKMSPLFPVYRDTRLRRLMRRRAA
jgi:peptidoglycan/xylan/chitin deacetylase (PgdA/CDA1 family)